MVKALEERALKIKKTEYLIFNKDQDLGIQLQGERPERLGKFKYRDSQREGKLEEGKMYMMQRGWRR